MASSDIHPCCRLCTPMALQIAEAQVQTRLWVTTFTTDELQGVPVPDLTTEMGFPLGTGVRKWEVSVSTILRLMEDPVRAYQIWWILG